MYQIAALIGLVAWINPFKAVPGVEVIKVGFEESGPSASCREKYGDLAKLKVVKRSDQDVLVVRFSNGCKQETEIKIFDRMKNTTQCVGEPSHFKLGAPFTLAPGAKGYVVCSIDYSADPERRYQVNRVSVDMTEGTELAIEEVP
jgi:hypothetical protein